MSKELDAKIDEILYKVARKTIDMGFIDYVHLFTKKQDIKSLIQQEVEEDHERIKSYLDGDRGYIAYSILEKIPKDILNPNSTVVDHTLIDITDVRKIIDDDPDIDKK